MLKYGKESCILCPFLLKDSLLVVHIGVQGRSGITFLWKTISLSQWDSHQASLETSISVIDWFTRAESWLISIQNPFSTFVKMEHPVQRWKKSVQYVSSSIETATLKFEWGDSLHKFAAIVNRTSEGYGSFSTLLALALLMLIFL